MAVIVAFSATALLGAAAFAIDESMMFTARRETQGVTDLAALSAVSSPPNAAMLAGRTVQRNGIPLVEPLKVETGTYVADPAILPALRFVAKAANVSDAVRVTVSTETETHFGRILGSGDTVRISTTATAANTSVASFTLGSRLASLDGGILNQLLSNALGGSISLTVMDYNALADARIDMFDFLNAVASEARLTGVTYDSILATDVKAGDVLKALATMTGRDTSLKPATILLAASISRLAKTSAKIKLGSDLGLGPYQTLPRDERPNADISLSALDILGLTARLADGTNQAAAGFNLNVPLLASVSAKVTVGEKPVTSQWTSVGRRGATVETAQTRIALNVKIAPLGLAEIALPIYVDVAKSKATLANATCAGLRGAESVTLDVTPSVVEAWIANVPASSWERMSSISSPPAAPIIKLGLIQVTGQAHVAMNNTTPASVAFNTSDIATGKTKTVSTRDYLTSITGSLLGDLKLGIAIGGIGILLPSQQSQIRNAISAVTAPLDNTLFTILTYLGIGVGQAEVTVNGVRCDRAVLVD